MYIHFIKLPVDKLLYGDNMEKKRESTNKEILHEIINRCNEEELNVLKDVIVAIYPDLNKILKKNK